jgi:ligand-binding SRPBCC domain-containing protein
MTRKIVRVTSVFPASVDVVWDKLQQLDTLQYIARPYATFEPQRETLTAWREGEISRFSLRLFGVIPLGVHTIHIVRFDREALTVQTREGNQCVPMWNHKINLKPLDNNKTEYTDEVELFAGFVTPMAYAWSVLFYRHRQRKWRKLLKEAAK